MPTPTPAPRLVFGSSQSGSSTGLGYHPDLPDFRDNVLHVDAKDAAKSSLPSFRNFREQWREVLKRSGAIEVFAPGKSASLPKSVDFRDTGCLSPVENQGQTNACTAYSTIGAVEYLMRLGGAGSEDVSAAFLYHNTRRLLNWYGDTGAYVRTTVKALRLFGVPPDATWPMEPAHIDGPPDAFTYGYAGNFKNLNYARLDGYDAGHTGATTLASLKRLLADGIPAVFGFPVYESFVDVKPTTTAPTPVIPFPGSGERLLGGHAVVAVGYDDSVESNVGKGGILIRNSWGPDWGDGGYAYLPYFYFEQQFAVDVWALYSLDWLDLSAFG
ncbi:MAG TPA: C1 family peptidase [Candidatus Didemnitutus sp.]|nr:C1 family peptidase [Candidatus Didemnitutus sp.]